VNYNTCDLLRDCLLSLRKVVEPSFEVVVVDNASTDGSVAMVRDVFPSVRLIQLENNLGFAGGNMRAYDNARGEYVCFLNSDTRVHPQFLSEMTRFMDANPTVGGCQPKIQWMRDPTRLDSVGDWLTWTGLLYHRGYLAPDDLGEDPIDIFAAKGACMMFRSSLLEKIGVFDENYWSYFEETDLCWRIWLSGHRMCLVPTAVVQHLLAGTSRDAESYIVSYHSFKNRIHSMIKNFGGWTLVRVLPVHLVICVGLAVIYSIRGQRSKARAIVGALSWNVRSIRGTWRQRAYIQKQVRVMSEHELMRIAMHRVGLKYFLKLYREYERV
jgi:GT2 family glycosyltransferase